MRSVSRFGLRPICSAKAMFHSLTQWPLCRLAASCAAAATILAASQGASAQSVGNAINGKSLYEAKCGGCHSVDANRIGPLHRGVVGRRVASVPDYDYSPALKQLGGIWAPERIDKWLQGPQDMAPGSNMYFSLDDTDQRRDIIAYLTTLLAPITAVTR